MRIFNTAGPCFPDRHYMLPAAERLGDARELIDQQSYFVLHAPRQSGKSTALIQLSQQLTAEGRYAALYASCEVAKGAGDDVLRAQTAILESIALSARLHLPAELRPPVPWPAAQETRLQTGLQEWALVSPRPVVLFLDEIDTLDGLPLITVLRQLRAGFINRPRGFPQAIALCGMRDVRDYKTASGGDPSRLGSASPFNIKVESNRLADFTQEEVHVLYAQHTTETGQPFEDEAVVRSYEYTRGQPWLTNAIAREIVEKMKIIGPISAAHVDIAKERLILARATHLDSLVKRLDEDRVRRIVEPILAGGVTFDATYDDDASYVRDLGLIGLGKTPEITNPIYREVIVRVLAANVEAGVTADPRSFVHPDGRFDVHRMLREFSEFWRLHSEVLVGKMAYHEVAAQLILMAFLQRVVNGGGFVEREYGVGRGRIDLVVRWPLPQGSPQLEAIELKAWHDHRPDPLGEGLDQLDAYLARFGLSAGVLVLFDQRQARKPVEDRIETFDATTKNDRAITVWRL